MRSEIVSQVLFGEDFEILENRTMVSHQNAFDG
jgi:hypothetical protein